MSCSRSLQNVSSFQEEVQAPECKRERAAMHMHTKIGNRLVAAEVVSAV